MACDIALVYAPSRLLTASTLTAEVPPIAAGSCSLRGSPKPWWLGGAVLVNGDQDRSDGRAGEDAHPIRVARVRNAVVGPGNAPIGRPLC